MSKGYWAYKLIEGKTNDQKSCLMLQNVYVDKETNEFLLFEDVTWEDVSEDAVFEIERDIILDNLHNQFVDMLDRIKEIDERYAR